MTYDVAIIGGGLAGGLAAQRMAEVGARVIVLESGPARSDGAAQAKDAGRWPGPILVDGGNGHFRRRAGSLMGHGPGGSSALYGSALERFADEDFTGARPSDKDALPTAWPVDAAAMAPWYDQAEALLGVGAVRPAISPRDRALVDGLRANGHAPYRLPTTIAYRPGCGECQAQRCPRPCKGEGWTRALAGADVTLRTGVHVASLEQGKGATTIHMGVEQITAKAVILAAGALNSPRLLLNSPGLFDGAPHPLIGRGLMFHATDLFAVSVPGDLATSGPKKTIGLRDFYDLPEGRGGEIQSLGFDLAPRLVSRYLAEMLAARGIPGEPYLMAALRIPSAMLARAWGMPPVLASVLEDLPYAENQVLAQPDYAPDAPIRVAYKVRPELTERAQAMRDKVKAAFAPLPVRLLLQRIAPNLGHPCGSVRMGDDPETAPVASDGQLRGTEGVYVADASTLPSSGGTNPALTVAANALRIVDGIAKSGF